MTNINPHPDRFDQEADFESHYFDNLRRLAENEPAGPGTEFTVEIELVPVTGSLHGNRSIHIREDTNTLGTLPENQVDTWWPLVCAMADAGETLSTVARVWTSPEWDERFYAGVWIALPTLDQAIQAIEDDGVDLTAKNLRAYQSFATPPASTGNALHGPAEGSSPFNVDHTPLQFTDDPDIRAAALQEYHRVKKTRVIAWVLWVILGDFGGHRYYLGNYPQAALMTVAGLLAWLPGMLWALIDAFNVNRRIREVNYGLWTTIATTHGVALEPLPEGTYK